MPVAKKKILEPKIEHSLMKCSITHVFEDTEEKTQQKQAETTEIMELVDRVVQVTAVRHGVRLWLMLISSYNGCDCYLNLA